MARLNTKGITKVSPAGLGQWVRVAEADDYGKFTANLVCDPSLPEVQAYKAIIDDLASKVKTETGKKKMLLPYAEDDEGNIVFKAKSPEFDKDNNPIKVSAVDTRKNEVTEAIGNGSTIKILAYIMPYSSGANTGISLRLKKVQVIDLVEYGEDFDYEDEFEATDNAPKTSDNVEDDEDF